MIHASGYPSTVITILIGIVVLTFGQKIAEGSPQEVMNNQMVKEAYLGTETKA